MSEKRWEFAAEELIPLAPTHIRQYLTARFIGPDIQLVATVFSGDTGLYVEVFVTCPPEKVDALLAQVRMESWVMPWAPHYMRNAQGFELRYRAVDADHAREIVVQGGASLFMTLSMERHRTEFTRHADQVTDQAATSTGT